MIASSSLAPRHTGDGVFVVEWYALGYLSRATRITQLDLALFFCTLGQKEVGIAYKSGQIETLTAPAFVKRVEQFVDNPDYLETILVPKSWGESILSFVERVWELDQSNTYSHSWISYALLFNQEGHVTVQEKYKNIAGLVANCQVIPLEEEDGTNSVLLLVDRNKLHLSELEYGEHYLARKKNLGDQWILAASDAMKPGGKIYFVRPK